MTQRENEIVFSKKRQVAHLSVIALQGAEELGRKINEHLIEGWGGGGYKADNFLIKNECPRFSSGDAKGILRKSIRGDDVYIIVDVGNYSCKYNFFGEENRMSPDDHYQDLKRIIQAAGGKAHRINVIMPVLYGGRQHKRSYRESLDCAVALQELEAMGVANIITFDAHDSRVCNSVPLMGFDNIIPSYQVLKSLFKRIKDLKIDKDSFMMISPDEGALHRNMYYASVLGVELGMFYKRRDYSKVINGRNPIVAHEYLGNAVKGKDVFICDDIISSGESMLEVAYELKKREAARIIVYATYPIFTDGLEAFDKTCKDGVIDYVFGTNLTYRTPELLSREWYNDVDISKYIAYLIAALNHDVSTGKVIDPHAKIRVLLKSYNKDAECNVQLTMNN
ncbi:MAG: ribose-phosphate pyrophosphokinase [Oscillospiraceae bacterium]|jgi:ribose-phosphate pyrophosphokinase|nr:ribose-phosphate pyrophosphokinase [Oscillospiraceae bacterium]